MKKLALILPLLALAAGCVSQVECLDDIADFKVTVDEETREVSITGFIASSSLGVARVVEKQCDDEFLIVVYSKPNVVTFRSGEINIKTRCPDDATSICFGDLTHRIWSSEKTPIPDAPAASESHAEPAEAAEPKPHAESAEDAEKGETK